MLTCNSCDHGISQEVADTTRLLISTLGAERTKTLHQIYEGTPPEQQCAPCFNAMAAVVNGAQPAVLPTVSDWMGL